MTPPYDVLLKETIARLAAPAYEQIAWLREIGTYPLADELALEFDNYFVTRWMLHQVAGYPEGAETVLEALDAKLASFSGEAHAAEWRATALTTSPHWAEVRIIARRTLDQLNRRVPSA